MTTILIADPLTHWREALKTKLLAEGRCVWTARRRTTRTSATNPPTRTRARTNAHLSPAKHRRAIERAYKTEPLIPWVPFWMATALFGDGEHAEDVWYGAQTAILAFRYADATEAAALETIARLGSQTAIHTFVERANARAFMLKGKLCPEDDVDDARLRCGVPLPCWRHP